MARKRGDPSRRPAAAVPGALLGLLPVIVAAGQDGPIVVSPRPDLEPIAFESLDVAFEFNWRRDVNQIDGPGGGRTRDIEDRFREILILGTDGYVGHPNLMAFDLEGQFWLTQRHFDSDSAGRRERSDEFLLVYDASAVFLQEQILPVTIFSRRSQNDINRQFGGSLENTNQETGLRLDLRSSVVPTTVQVFRRNLDQVDHFSGSTFSIDQDTLQADGRVNIAKNQQIWWDYEYNDIFESGQRPQPLSYNRTQFNVTHRIDWGERREHQLRSAVRVFQEGGDRDLDQFRLFERLRIQPSDDLQTWVDFTLDRQDRDDTSQRRLDVTGNFRHQLFESLTTTGRLGYNELRIPTDDYQSQEVFGDVVLDYIKKVPGGRIYLSGLAGRSELNETDRGAPIDVVDQPAVFDASGLVVLQGRNIVTSSIRITDVSGLILYTEGLDYTVLGLPDRVEIRRIPGGDIAAGQAVLIDYVIGPEPGGTTTSDTLGIEARYTFEEGPLTGLSLYAEVRDQNESRSIVTPDFPENDFTDFRYGVEYDAWKLYLKAERQMRDSTLSPFDSTRFEARYFDRFGRGSALVLSFLYQQVDRDDVELRTATTTVSAQWNQRLTDRLNGNLLLLFQDQDDTTGLDFQAYELEMQLWWRYRQTEISARFRNSIKDSDTANDTLFQTFYVGLRRDF